LEGIVSRSIKEIAKSYLTENLGGIPHLDNPEKFSLPVHLLIRDDNTGIEYTVADVDLSDEDNPKITCYRYDPSDATTFYLDISKEDFDKYSLA
tara:strand:+ start:242 stop:523 length:282 start_codon:yes stop_codon:yes gene_type:complete